MKFLCLHGNGTSSYVLMVQTAPLRNELEDGHEFEFVEGTVEVPMFPGVESLAGTEDRRFYAYYNPADTTTIPRALSQLDEYVRAEGPFDAILGFSAGAVLAAMYLVDQQRRQKADEGAPPALPFKCAVLLSPGSSSTELAWLGFDAQKDTIRIPTAHVWGSADDVAPTGGQDLAETCDASRRQIAIHGGGHELPSQSDLTKAVHIIRKTIFDANQPYGVTP
ncbi:DUF341 domain protein [Apiospora arundinis]|uniref:DUF341 domain protein n=1 Tax=Apiospora arundinis TaxID=335852 RepID=A0ABR2HP87_9PEZI